MPNNIYINSFKSLLDYHKLESEYIEYTQLAKVCCEIMPCLEE